MKSIGKLFLAVTLSAVSLAAVGDEYEEQVRLQLQIVENALARDGWESTHDFFIDKLRDGNTDYIEVELDRGWDYQIVSVCDSDCGDLDLTLYDERGREVDVDKSDDDVPVVVASPSSTQNYTLEVKMYECGHNPCRYGIGVFGQ